MSDFYNTAYNPDVLSCIANLSNDEVFTPPEIANQMLDMLPQDLFKNPDAKFLDPACKSGVFLREIAKRLIDGLADQIPDLQERIDHIFQTQLYGIAITELTSLLSRRSLYCSKYPNSKYSITHFDDVQGNIRYKNIHHTWMNDKCVFCGVGKKDYSDEKRKNLESHAYEFIHINSIEDIYTMKFDVIIGNPPYQLQVNETGKGLGAIPIYQKFVEKAKKLNPKYIVMITPSRWFSGGVGLDKFRNEMLSDKRIEKIIDYTDSKDCFPGVDINGGISYFLWNFCYNGLCEFTNITNGVKSIQIRNLDEFKIFIRRNEAVSIIHKVLSKNERKLSENGGCSPQTPYGFLSTFVGKKEKDSLNDCEILSSKGWMYVNKNEVLKSKETIGLYKTLISKLSCEHAGNPDKNGMYRVLSRMEILLPNQICTQSYLIICPTKTKKETENVYAYLRTKFVRFLILQTLSGMNISINNFIFVPWQDFAVKWTDELLYEKYGLNNEKIDFIENIIRNMENE